MADKLSLYNAALGHLGPVRLKVLTENRPDRHELDVVYLPTLKSMLERGCWFFALRTIQLDPDPDFEPLFGAAYSYTIPSDYVRLRLISTDPMQHNEDRTYRREGNSIRSVHPQLFMTYVSDAPEYGMNLGAFPQLYADAVAAELAYRSGLPITKDRGTKNDLFVLKKNALSEAKRVDAVDERVKEKPASSWLQSRDYRGNLQRRAPL